MANYQDGFGKSGIASLKEETFKEKFEWQLKEFPKDKKRTILEIPLVDYYYMGLFCIRNNISINQFIKDSLYLRLEFAKRTNITDINAIEIKSKKITKKKYDQGSLF